MFVRNGVIAPGDFAWRHTIEAVGKRNTRQTKTMKEYIAETACEPLGLQTRKIQDPLK